MPRRLRRIAASCLPLACLFALVPTAHGQWTAPTTEELTMSSQPEVPHASAIYLFREEINDDNDPSWSIYVRLKVLTEEGRKYANVQLNEFQASNRSRKIVDIQGRTIHPDGAIIPFAEKPVDKLVTQREGLKENSKEFTLPDVQVGSILEYRYKVVFDDHHAYAPAWYVQSELFTRKAHYKWIPTTRHLVMKDVRGVERVTRIEAVPVLPKGAVFKQSGGAGNTRDLGETDVELKIDNVPPAPREDYMPPINNLSYRVLFYYMAYKTGDEFWQDEGYRWSKASDEFIGPGPKVQVAARQLVGPSDTQEQKLRKIYAAVMQVENLTYTRGFPAGQDAANGIQPPKTTDDLWERKAGHSDQIAELFVAMTRAAGMKAYLMSVSNRNRNFFIPEYLSLSQLQDSIAIVNVNGKEEFFDPGEPSCPYGQLASPHSDTRGLRQTERGTAIAATPVAMLTASRIQRVANLTMDEHGIASGTVKLTWTGQPALTLRQTALRGSFTLQISLEDQIKQMIPAGTTIAVSGIQNLAEYEDPLVVTYNVRGPLATLAGSRMTIPGEFFEANAKQMFPQEKRETPVYLGYPRIVQDAVRIAFPPGFGLETTPETVKLLLQKDAAYSLSAEPAPASISVRREFDLGNPYYKVDQYPELRTFYNDFQSKDREAVVLKALGQAPAGN
jgi:hypothetical protein